MTTNTDKSRIMHMARAIFDANPSLSWSDCMKRAWDFHWFRQMLTHGIVNFRYWKRNPDATFEGDPFILREARGTLLTDIIPEDKRPKGSQNDKPGRKPNYKNMAYYDLDRKDWRSFDINHFECTVSFVSANNV